MPARITIKDIAKALKIHHSTVSRALRNDVRVKENTRKLVKEYAAVHGYKTNVTALELRGGRKNTIAVIVPNINHHFFSSIISAFTDIANNKEFVVSVFQTNENSEQEIKIIETIIQYNFAGVIASISMGSDKSSHFDLLMKQNIPLVMFDRVHKNLNTPKVLINNVEIMKDLISILIKKGYKRIAHITGPAEINVFADRNRGYKQGLSENGLSYSKTLHINHGFMIEDGVKAAKELFNINVYPDAVISDSAVLIIGLIKELREKKKGILQKTGLVTFGENQFLDIMDVPIINIIQPHDEIAQKTFDLLYKRIENKVSDNEEVVLLSARIQKN